MVGRLDWVIINEGNAFTFRRGNTGSRVDITLCTSGVAARTLGWRVLEDITLSDHQYIEFKIHEQINPVQNKPIEKIKGWQLKKLNLEKLRTFLTRTKEQRGLQEHVDTEDLDSLVTFTMKTITEACNKSMPKRSNRIRGRGPVYWWTTEIAELRKKCLYSRRKMQRARRNEENAALSEAFKEARKELRRAIKHSKRKCWLDLCQELDEDPWGRPFKIVTQKMIRQQIPGILNTERISKIVLGLFPKHEERTQREIWDENQQEERFNINQLQEAARRLKKGKAPGPDNIPNEIVVKVVDVWPELLFQTYNACLHKVVFPKIWKRQQLVLLRKGTKPLDEPSSYRPISLLDTVGKLLELMILCLLEKHVE